MKGSVLALASTRLGQRLAAWVGKASAVLSAPLTTAVPAASATPAPSLPSYASLAQAADFPVLRAHELIEVLELQPRIDAIRQLLGLPAPDWQVLGQAAIERVAEAVQLCPASEVHHHAYAGGLLVHTLEVAEHALRLRKRYQLPIGAGAEAINEAGPRWTYGVFAAALLHDPGKLAAGIHVLVGPDGQRWTPLDHPLSAGLRYRVTFASVPYRLHAQASLALFSTLLPPEARRWLGSDKDLLSQCLSTTYEVAAPDGGAIAEIIQQADGTSVRADLGHHSTGALASAQSVPLIDRMMRAARRLIADGELQVNAPGAQVWVSAGRQCTLSASREAWVLCKSLADAIIGRMQADGDQSVPRNNERLFDTLQEHGMVKATRAGQAVWHVRITLDNWSSDFRVLRFPAWKLWPSGRIPEAKAKVRVLGTVRKKTDKPLPAPDNTEGLPSLSSVEPAGAEPACNSSDEDLLHLLLGKGAAKKQRNTQPPAASRRSPGASTVGAPATSAPADAQTDTSTLGDAARDFLLWLKSGLSDGGISSNEEGAFVHGGPDETLLLVSPRCFREYALQRGHDWTEAQAALGACIQVRRHGKRTVIPFRVTRGNAVVNCMVIEKPQALDLPRVPSNALLQPLHP